MPTHAALAQKLLNDAAAFFRMIGEENKELKAQMTENAKVFDDVARLLVEEPEGKLGDQPHSTVAGRLLADAAEFFRQLAEQNEPIKEQMEENARVYEQIGALVTQNPDGILD